jgi:hypothetical protein
MNQPVEWNDAQFGWSIQIYPDDTRRTRHWAHQLVAGTCSPCVKPPWFSKTVVFFRGKHRKTINLLNPSHNSYINITIYIYTYYTITIYIYIHIYIFTDQFELLTYPKHILPIKITLKIFRIFCDLPSLWGFLLSAQVSNESGVRRCPSNDGKKLRSPQTELCMTC